jgi:hypothetical protein
MNFIIINVRERKEMNDAFISPCFVKPVKTYSAEDREIGQSYIDVLEIVNV